MGSGKDKRLRGRLARGTLLSLFLHANAFGPFLFMVWRWAADEDRERAETVDVSFDSAPEQELPPLPPGEEPPVEAEKIPPAPAEKAPQKKPEKKPPEKKQAKAEPKKPEPEKKVAEKEVVVPPLPPMPQPPPPPPAPPPPKSHEKVVDLDNEKEVEPPPDAKFLAQKNNRADVETRAQETNLERDQKQGPEGQTASRVDPKASDQTDVGDEKAKIAQLEEQKGAFGHEVPKAPQARDREETSDEDEAARRSVLAIREAAPRLHTVSPETADPSLPHDPAGMRPTPRTGDDDHDHDHARMAKGDKVKLALSGRDYEYLFGAQAETERRVAQKARSARAGKQAARLARIRSALENFIPEVKPGNQTALNTRAAPFAAFIAAMHRSIHELWGFGILEDWDELGAASPLNNENLMTNLEVVLNGDGSVDKVTVVQASKYLPFDVAAIDVAYSAGPYPQPPREIRSGNGKIYIHWRFFRDGRQCATSGVDYFILDNKGKDDDRGQEQAEGGAPSPQPDLSLRRLSRGPDGEARGGGRAASGVATAEGAAEAQASKIHDDDEVARRQAAAWWTAFSRGDVGALASRSSLPFRAGETITAKTSDELVPMLRNLLEETTTRNARGFDVLTGAALRKVMGRLPAGFDDGSGRLFVLVRTAGDAFILRLASVTDGDWRVDGLLRR